MPNTANRTARIEARATPEGLAIIQRGAALQGRSVSDFVFAAAEKEARAAIMEDSTIRLSPEDQVRFVEMLLNPPPPAPAMIRAFEHYNRLIVKE